MGVKLADIESYLWTTSGVILKLSNGRYIRWNLETDSMVECEPTSLFVQFMEHLGLERMNRV